MSYDSLYNQLASLSAIAGNYQELNFNLGGPFNITISGSSITISEEIRSSCTAIGTIAPHGTVNIFDASLTVVPECYNDSLLVPMVSTDGSAIAATGTYNGILFQEPAVLGNNFEIVATDGKGGVMFLMESK